jgi:nucleoside-diphosphate-sugar epimerase
VRVFVAGATGALGLPTVKALVSAGHAVIGLTRSPAKAALLQAHGATVAHADVLDANAIKAAVATAAPDAVVQVLNALPKNGPRRMRDVDATNRLRIDGTRNLLDAAVTVGASRYIAESVIVGYAYGDFGPGLITEEQPFTHNAPAVAQPAIDALRSLEDQVRQATRKGRIEGIILRFGVFYGPEVASTQFWVKLLRRRLLPLPGGGRNCVSYIHVDDAAAAITAALERGTPGATYNIVDDQPATSGDFLRELARVIGAPQPLAVPVWAAYLAGDYARRFWDLTLPVSNAKAKAELGWQPRYPTYREGLGTLPAPAAPAR